MNWLRRSAQKGNLVIIDESSQALAHYKEQYTKLGYNVSAILAVPQTARFAQLRNDDGTLDPVQYAIQKQQKVENLPSRLDVVNFMVSNTGELQNVLRALKPAPDFVLSDHVFEYAKTFINGAYIMDAARAVLPNAALVVHSPGYDSAGFEEHRPLTLKTAVIHANSTHAEVEKNPTARKPQAHLVFEAIARTKEASLTA